MSPPKCSYVNCDSCKDVSMFRFPTKHANRLDKWLTNCGNNAITYLSHERLRSRYLCSKHFDDKYIIRNPGRVTKLTKDAVPWHHKEDFTSEALAPPISSEDQEILPKMHVVMPRKVYKRSRMPNKEPNQISSGDNSKKSTEQTKPDVTPESTQRPIKKKMENLLMCRICLTNGSGMKELLDKNLQEIYVELTYMPFVKEDGRPTLVCYVCLARLRNCHKLRVQCVRSERFFTQLLNSDALQNKEDVSSTNGMKTTPMFLLTVGGETEMPAECEVKSEPEIDLVENDSEECIVFETDYAFLPQEEFYSEVDVITTVEPDENITMDLEEIVQVPKKENINGITHKRIFVGNESNCEEKNHYNTLKTEQIREQIDSQRIFVNDEPIFDAKRDNDPLKTEPIDEEIDNMELSVDIEKDCGEENVNTPQKILSQNCEEMGNTSVSNSYEGDEKAVNSCKLCVKIFSSPRNLQIHMRRIHGERKHKKRNIATGNIMPKTIIFLSKQHLEIRNHRKHIIKTFQCVICKRTFNNKIDMLKHASTHSGHTKPTKTRRNKIFICDICGKKFNHKTNMIGHIRRHSDYKPFKCDVCKNRFHDKYSLQNHRIVHSNEKPFMCDVCGTRFKRIQNLNRHYRWHNKEKPYQCDVCEQSFDQKVRLRIHTRIHRGN